MSERVVEKPEETCSGCGRMLSMATPNKDGRTCPCGVFVSYKETGCPRTCPAMSEPSCGIHRPKEKASEKPKREMVCDTCDASGDEPCMTSGGYVAQQPHGNRFKKGYTFEMQANHLLGSVGKYVKGGPPPGNPLEKVKLALWFVTTMGSVDEAQKALDAAKAALAPYKTTAGKKR